MDGTLADTGDAHRICFNKAFAENHLSWNWEVALYDKRLKVTGSRERIKFFVENSLPTFPKPADYDRFDKRLHLVKTSHYTAMLMDGPIPPRPGIKRRIDDARAGSIQFAATTITLPENIAALLEVGLGKHWQSYFACIGCGGIVPRKKPVPDICLWVPDDFGLGPGDCSTLEDSNNDLRSSGAAGSKTYIPVNRHTRDQDFRGAAAIFDDLGELDALFRAVGMALAK